MLHSSFEALAPVRLPYAGRQRYMWGFDVANPVMEEGFEDYLEPVSLLCAAAGRTEGKAFMTVDERMLKAGETQRRPGPHVDGQFNIKAVKWGGGGGGGWNHSCNLVPLTNTPIIVAASVPGCRAWAGEFDARPKEDGDLSHIADQLGQGIVLPANVGFLLSPDCIHESMPMTADTERTFLRIALP